MGEANKARDPRELTDDEAFEIRRVAMTIGWKLGEIGLAAGLHSIADEHDAPYPCEACGARATETDAENVPLCDVHYSKLAAEAERRYGVLVRLYKIVGVMPSDAGCSFDAWKAVDDALHDGAVDPSVLPTFLDELEKLRDTWTPELEAVVREARTVLGEAA